MLMRLKLLLTISCLTLAVQSKADSWIDPDWKEMLDKSAVIALIQYTGNGDFRARAKILVVYKGQVKAGDEIWISGFSNRYGPIDKMKNGDRYIVFLNLQVPTARSIEILDEELAKKPELKEFVVAYKDKRSFYVWTATSGDLKVAGKTVQYDLTSTTFYKKQQFYSLKEFEDFLKAYHQQQNAAEFCKSLLNKLRPASEAALNTQLLMQLYLLGFNQYDDVFEQYTRVNNISSRYALAQLMGNIKTEPSRKILFTLVEDKNSLVQGEAARQLTNEPVELVGQILLKNLHSSSEVNFGSSNIMNPVMNAIDGGKVEIIRALGELKFKPAIPELLLLLDTDNERLFRLAIDALKNMGSREYIAYINKHLEKKTHNLIFPISTMIAEDSLIECLPDFRNFISTCNRNQHINYVYTISECCGIGHFNNKTTISFLLSDYERFFTYKDTLESSNQRSWTNAYFEIFTELKLKEARPLIYRSVYDWMGYNQDFGTNPALFKLKANLEDTFRHAFNNRLSSKQYALNHCIAFIENTSAVISGEAPVVRYMIEATIPLPSSSFDKAEPHQEIIAKELNLPAKDIFIKFSDGIYYNAVQDRFAEHNTSTFIDNFLDYVKAVPDQASIKFLQGLLDHNCIRDKFYQDRIKEAIGEMK
jgi:hypothetical protein